MKENEVFDCIYTRPYAEDDALLNDFVDNIFRRVSWKMFENQEQICYMISEKNPPMLKDNAIEYMRAAINSELSWLRNYIICRMLISYRMSNVDLGEECEWYLHDELGKENWEDFTQKINKYIWNDYAKYLGEDGAKKYFEKINRLEYIPEEFYG